MCLGWGGGGGGGRYHLVVVLLQSDPNSRHLDQQTISANFFLTL